MRRSRNAPHAPADADLRLAMQHHHAGRLAEAAAAYEGVLERNPRHGDALHLLGTLALQMGQLEQAIALLSAAVRANPAQAEYHTSLGGALHRAGRLTEALESFQHAREMQPGFATAQLNCGRVEEQLGDLSAAAASYRRAGELDRTMFDAFLREGAVRLRLQQPEEAIAASQRALALRPDSAEAHFNLGHAMEASERLNDAASSYREALRLNPQLAEAHNNLGSVLRTLHDLDGAQAAFAAAIAQQPDFAVAFYNLATVLSEKKEFAAAIENFHAAIALQTDFAGAYYNLGNAYRDQGNSEQAKQAYTQAITLQPNFALCYTALGQMLSADGSAEIAEAFYREALRLEPENPDTLFNLSAALREQARLPEAARCLERALELNPRFTKAYSNLLYQHATTRDVSPEEELHLARAWEYAALTAEERAAAHRVTFLRAPREGRKLRLGILSAEIGQHAVSEFLEPLLTGIDRKRFHVTLFPTVVRQDARTARMMALADAVTPVVDLSDQDAADLVRASALDILVETTGHTRECRLGVCARRVAPVQISYIGYWSTTGLTEIDWVLGDRDAPGWMDFHFCERIWRLPRLSVCYRGDSSLPASAWQPAADGTIWLGSFNRSIKIREATLTLWARVMRALPEAKLLLEDRAPDCTGSHDRILSGLDAHGIDADRIHFEPFIPGHERHMRLYDRLDIALDTIPFTSGTTACDALWMGVPLVTLEGNWHGGRIAATFLKAAGLGQWVARDEDEYVALVTKLARDMEGRRQLRQTQRERISRSELCDANGLTHALEDAFQAMFDECQARSCT